MLPREHPHARAASPHLKRTNQSNLERMAEHLLIVMLQMPHTQLASLQLKHPPDLFDLRRVRTLPDKIAAALPDLGKSFAMVLRRSDPGCS